MDHHVANVHPDAEEQARLCRNVAIHGHKYFLGLDGALDDIDAALGNSASTLSPAVLAMRPPNRTMCRSRISRWAVSARKVPASSRPMRRE